MLNQFVLVGKIQSIDEDSLNLSVPRYFKNENDDYETDIIKCRIFGAISKNTNELCKKGDLIGVKGRIQEEKGNMIIIAEKVTFLSSKKESEE